MTLNPDQWSVTILDEPIRVFGQYDTLGEALIVSAKLSLHGIRNSVAKPIVLRSQTTQ